MVGRGKSAAHTEIDNLKFCDILQLLCIMGEPFEFHEDINGAVVNVRHGGDRIGEFLLKFDMFFVSIYCIFDRPLKTNPFRLM